jgi:hypothetical protein
VMDNPYTYVPIMSSFCVTSTYAFFIFSLRVWTTFPLLYIHLKRLFCPRRMMMMMIGSRENVRGCSIQKCLSSMS